MFEPALKKGQTTPPIPEIEMSPARKKLLNIVDTALKTIPLILGEEDPAKKLLREIQIEKEIRKIQKDNPSLTKPQAMENLAKQEIEAQLEKVTEPKSLYGKKIEATEPKSLYGPKIEATKFIEKSDDEIKKIIQVRHRKKFNDLQLSDKGLLAALQLVHDKIDNMPQTERNETLNNIKSNDKTLSDRGIQLRFYVNIIDQILNNYLLE